MLEGIPSDKLVHKLMDCLECLQPHEPSLYEKAFDPNREEVMLQKDGETIFLNEEGRTKFFELRDLIRDKGQIDGESISDFMSDKSIKNHVEQLLVDSIKFLRQHHKESTSDEKQLIHFWEDWRGDFDDPRENYRVFSFIENLELNNEMQLGEFSIEPISEELLWEYFDHSDFDDELLDEMIEDYLSKSPRSVVELKVKNVDSNLSEQIFREKIFAALNILRFYGRMVFSPTDRREIGLIGNIFQDKHEVIKIPENGNTQVKSQYTGKLYSFEVNDDVRDFFNQCHFSETSQILAKPEDKRNEIESRLLNSMIWVGRATTEKDGKSRFMKNYIALDGLLLEQYEKGKEKDNLSERISVLCGGSKSKDDSIRKDAEEIYDIRCDIAHEGRVNRDEDEFRSYLDNLERMALAIIMNFYRETLERNWSEFDDFKNWV